MHYVQNHCNILPKKNVLAKAPVRFFSKNIGTLDFLCIPTLKEITSQISLYLVSLSSKTYVLKTKWLSISQFDQFFFWRLNKASTNDFDKLTVLWTNRPLWSTHWLLFCKRMKLFGISPLSLGWMGTFMESTSAIFILYPISIGVKYKRKNLLSFHLIRASSLGPEVIKKHAQLSWA